MNDTPFIGTGSNPEGPDLPLGLGMRLAQDPNAMECFGRIDTAQKGELIAYIQGAQTGEEAQERMSDVIHRLHEYRTLYQ